IQARRSRAWERAYRWVRRNKVVAALAGLVLLAFLGGFAGVFWQWLHTRAILAVATTRLYFQFVYRADREMLSGNTGAADVLLEQCPEALRPWEWYSLKRRCHSAWLRLEGHADQVRCMAYSADGKRLASGSNDRTVRVWDTATGRQLLTLRGHGG